MRSVVQSSYTRKFKLSEGTFGQKLPFRWISSTCCEWAITLISQKGITEHRSIFLVLVPCVAVVQRFFESLAEAARRKHFNVIVEGSQRQYEVQKTEEHILVKYGVGKGEGVQRSPEIYVMGRVLWLGCENPRFNQFLRPLAGGLGNPNAQIRLIRWNVYLKCVTRNQTPTKGVALVSNNNALFK